MRLLPREQDRLHVFLAAELARRRRARGLRLTQAEATALIVDEVMEAARDGLDYEQVLAGAYRVLGPEDVLDEVPRLLTRIELEALFGDGMRLIVLEDPIGAAGPPPLPEDPPVAWLDRGRRLDVVNDGVVPVAVSSHFHLFEVNRALRFDRRAAWGMRLAVAAGVKVAFEPGQTREVFTVPIGGRRVIRGHGGLVDGPLDEPGALQRALALARERGYRGA